MTHPTPLYRSIVFSLFRHVFGAYVVIAVLVTAFQAWDEYRVTTRQTVDYLQASGRIIQDGLANAVWHLDKPLIHDLVSGLLSRSKVVGVRVLDERQQVMVEQGQLQENADSELVHRLSLIDPSGSSATLLIGSVELHSSDGVILQAVRPTYVALLIAAIVKTAALWLIFFYFGRRLLGLPLMRMARDLDVDERDAPAGSPQAQKVNEIEALGLSIRNLQQSSEYRLSRSERRFQQILDFAGEGILVLDARGIISYGNPAAGRLLGWRAGDMSGADPSELFARRRGETATIGKRCEIQTVLETGVSIEREDATFYRRDGSELPVSFKSSPILEAGAVTGAVVVLRDVSEQRRHERILTQSRNTYQTLLDNLPEQVVYKNAELACISANRSFAESVGRQPNEIPGKRARDLFEADQARRIEMADRRVVATGKRIKFEDVQQRGDACVYTQTIASPVFDQSGEVIGVLTIIWDITHLKEAEKERQRMEIQLHQAQKLESVGQLAAGIAHEINTPVQFVSDNTNFLRDAFGDLDHLLSGYRALFDGLDEPFDREALAGRLRAIEDAADLDYLREEIPGAIDQSMSGLQRISKIVLAMKEFSHPGNNEKTPVDLNRAIQSSIEVSRNEWKYQARLTTDFDPNLPLVPVLPGEFNQVILNLIINASHAIQAAYGDDSKGEIGISTRLLDEHVEVRVSDNGTGIPAEIRQRVFDPFFTTKEVGKGTGQGLAIAYSAIVDKHQGSIELESTPGVGTTFIIRLPLLPIEAFTEATA